MNVGDEFEIYLGYHLTGAISSKQKNKHKFRVIEINNDKCDEKKDVLVCEEVDFGYKECFHRMDVEKL
jgi:hypothetical protein